MYRRPKFLELLLAIRREMALEADYDIDLFVEGVRKAPARVNGKTFSESQPDLEPPEIVGEIFTVTDTTREARKG